MGMSVLTTGLVALIPYQVIRQPCASFSYKLIFRLYCGSLSTVLNIHDAHNKPKSGICIANHTSPIDIVMLSTDNMYSLVRNFIIFFSFSIVFLFDLVSFLWLNDEWERFLFRLGRFSKV